MSIQRFRGWLYFAAKYLGDLQAIRSGKVLKRIGRRIAGKFTGRALGRIFR